MMRPDGGFSMPGRSARLTLVAALLLTSMTLSAGSAFAQSQAAEDPPPNSLKSEIDTLKAENAVVRDLLRKMEEQQKALLEQVDRLQRRLDGVPAAAAAATAATSVPQASTEQANKDDHYR